jgi:CheY-like chemotaxis protein
LVLLDLQMPGMDGFETLKLLRQHETERQLPIPVVALTAHAVKGDRERCYQAGFDGYVSKPIVMATLYRTIDEVLSVTRSGTARPFLTRWRALESTRTVNISDRLTRREDVFDSIATIPQKPSELPTRQAYVAALKTGVKSKPSKAAATTDNEMAEPSAPPPTSTMPALVDRIELLRRIGNDKKLMSRIIEIFLRDAPSQLDAMCQAIEKKNSADLRLAAHTFKGAVGYFGQGPAFQLGQQLEHDAKLGNFARGQSVLIELKPILEQLSEELQNLLHAECAAKI